MRARITTVSEFRAWLARHRVHTFSVRSKSKTRYVAGLDDRNVSASVEVPAAVMHEVDADLVWQHDPEGHRLPEKTMFALRSQLRPLH